MPGRSRSQDPTFAKSKRNLNSNSFKNSKVVSTISGRPEQENKLLTDQDRSLRFLDVVVHVSNSERVVNASTYSSDELSHK